MLEGGGEHTNGKVFHDENEQEETERSGDEDHHLPRFTPLYATPTALFKWGQKQPRRHVDWGDLFFDVIYVGVCFQSGNVLVQKTESKAYTVTPQSFLTFLAIFWCLYYGWESRLVFKAKLQISDKFHTFLHVLQGLLIALAAHSLSKDIIKEFQLSAVFSFSLLIHCFLDLIVVLEVMLLRRREREAVFMTRVFFPAALLRASFLAASICVLYSQLDTRIVLALWFCSYMVPSFFRFWAILCECIKPKKAIPLDVRYFVQRYGEWTMLILGESVIQIVLAEAEYDNFWYYVKVIMSYLLVAMLELLHYSMNPHNPEDHALRKSRYRGLLWHHTQLIYSTSLLVVGVTMKLGFQEKTIGFDWMLCSFVFISIFLLFIQQLLHLGIREELGIIWSPLNDTSTWLCIRFTKGQEKKRIWFGKLLVACIILLVPLFGVQESRKELFVFIVDVLLLLVIVLQVISGAFKRDKKIKKTLATLKAVNKFKRLLGNPRKGESLDRNPDDTHIAELSVDVGDGNAKDVDTEIVTGAAEAVSVESVVKVERMSHTEYSDQEAAGGVKPEVKKQKGSFKLQLPAKELTRIAHQQTKGRVRHVAKVYRRVRQMNLYDVPTNLVNWESLEREHETNWADLFFDLTYVALALKLGMVMTSGFLLPYDTHIEVWFFVSTFVATFDCWFAKTFYSTTVFTTDLFHKIVDVLEGLLVTILACSIPEGLGHPNTYDVSSGKQRMGAEAAGRSQLNERHFAFAFGSVKFLWFVLMILRYVEIYFTAVQINLKLFGKRRALRLVVAAIPHILSFIPAAFLSDTDERSVLLAIVTFFWFLPYLVESAIIVLDIISRKVWLHRFGDWIILMLGAGVLGLIKQEPFKDSFLHWLVFVLSFLVLSLLRKLHFHVDRFDPGSHAARFSRLRGFLCVNSTFIVSLTILALGYSLVGIDRELERNDENVDFFWAFAESSTVYFFLLWGVDILHVGWDEILFTDAAAKWKRSFVYFMKMLISLNFLAFPASNVQAYIILLIAIITIVVAWGVHNMHMNQRFVEHAKAAEITRKKRAKGIKCLSTVRKSSLTIVENNEKDANVVEDVDECGGVLVRL